MKLAYIAWICFQVSHEPLINTYLCSKWWNIADSTLGHNHQTIVKQNKQKMAENLQNKKSNEAQAAEIAKQVEGVQPIWDKVEIDALTGDRLKDHVKVFINAGAPNLSHIKSSAT